VTITEIIGAIAELDPADCPAILAAVAARLAQTRESPPDHELIDVDEAARMLGVSRSWLYHRTLHFVVKVGGRRMFSRDGIRKFIEKNRGKA
jgi:Helix-turn-helix domain